MATITVVPKSVATPVGTFTAASGGPVEASFSYGGRELTEWTGDAFYGQSFVVDGTAAASVTVRDLAQSGVPGTKGSVVIVATGKVSPVSDKSDVTITLTNMVYVGAGPATQPRAAAGSITLRFVHDSTDGTTSPIS